MLVKYILIRAFNYICQRDVVFFYIGKLNKRWQFISTIFIMYPATDEYAEAYVHRNLQKIMRWEPYLVGFFVQNGKVGLKFGISSNENAIRDKSNSTKLTKMVNYAAKVKSLVGAQQISFSGILPGVLNEQRIIRGSVEAKVTVEAVLRAEAALRTTLNLSDSTPLVVLGGSGFIGRRVCRRIADERLTIEDPANTSPPAKKIEWFKMYKGKRIILLNLANENALNQFTPHLWPEIVILNEVYPEPSIFTINKIKNIGCSLYHIVGLKGVSFPKFPKAYKGGIPCCAGRVSDELQPLITKLA